MDDLSPPKVSFDDLVAKLDKVKNKTPWSDVTRAVMGCCPAHDDKNPSLSVYESVDGETNVRCWAGCSDVQVFNALGWNWWDAKRQPKEETKLKTTDDMQCFLMVAQSARDAGTPRKSTDKALERKVLTTLIRRQAVPSWYRY